MTQDVVFTRLFLLSNKLFKQKKSMQATRKDYEKLRHFGFLGGDVSKGMCDFILKNQIGEELESNFQLDDNELGHTELNKLIKNWKKTHQLKKIIVGVESTGGYENNWYRFLRSKSKALNLEVFRINPRRVYFESKKEGRQTKTDAVSACVLANYLRKNYGEGDLILRKSSGSEKYANMRTLHKYIGQLSRQNTRIKNMLEKLLYKFMPELLAIKPEQYTGWFLEMLSRYPTKESIINAGITGLSTIKYLNEGKATQIISVLTNSVGGTMDRFSQLAFEEQLADITNLTQKIKRLKEQFVEMVKEKLPEDVEIVCSIPGIGEDTATGLLVEIEDVNRFEKASSLSAFFGANPTIKQSGDTTFYTGMSKDGSSSARATLYMAAKNAVIHEPYFKALYAKHRGKGKKHNQALGVVMTKIARVLVGMLKSRTKFNSGVDIYNQNKKPENQKTNCSKINKKYRRYQDATTDAPVSYRQKRRRKQELLPQVENLNKCEVSNSCSDANL